MPKLIIFAACNRVLIEDRGTASLITLTHELTVSIKGDTKIPKNTVSPIQWAVFTRWEREIGDDNKEFLQVIQVLWPDGAEFKSLRSPFRFQPDKNAQQIRFEIGGFPVGQEGRVALDMWLELDSEPIGETLTWTINVKHQIEKE